MSALYQSAKCPSGRDVGEFKLRNHLCVAVFSILAVFIGLSLSACTGGSGGDAWRYDPGIPPQVTGLKAVPGNKTVSLTWDGNPLAVKFNVYYVCALTENGVTKSNGIKVNVEINKPFYTVGRLHEKLNNNITYYFMVTAVNRDGESIGSAQVAATPRPISNEDLAGTWYFHTLITSPNAAEARWERGTMTVTAVKNEDDVYVCSAEISGYEVSNENGGSDTPDPPAGFGLSVNGNGDLTQTSGSVWRDFHGTMGSRKNMMIATYSPGPQSRAITIFQKKRADADYSIDDMKGTGSEVNGPTRFAYHQLYSGSNTEWEYSNGKMGKDTNLKYWDYSTPTFKVVNFYFLFNATHMDIDTQGKVTEYWNFPNFPYVVDSDGKIYYFNNLVPRQPYQALFTGRMTDDKTVIVGVGTRTDAVGKNPQYFLRIIQLCFIPDSPALPQPTVANDLTGSYKFHKLGFNRSVPTAASWAYGVMDIASSGATTLSESANSTGATILSNYTLYYYPDPNPDKVNSQTGESEYRDFANFTTVANTDSYSNDRKGNFHYHNLDGTLIHSYYEFYNKRNITDTGASYVDINNPSTWRPMTDNPSDYRNPADYVLGISQYYYNEHASLSLYGDMLVMTRVDSSGYSIIIGLI